MAGSYKATSSHRSSSGAALPSRTPGPLGINDAADPSRRAELGDTPGPLGINDHAQPEKQHPDKFALTAEAAVPALAPSQLKTLPTSDEDDYPRDLAMFVSYLMRGGYIRQVSEVIPGTWRTMSEADLTAFLSTKYSEAELQQMFVSTYAERAAIKATFRKANIISALVIGLVWARENIREGEWGQAAAKIGGSGMGAYVLNKLLYARDPKALEIMARRAGRFGRWFQGAARTNRFVSFLVRDLGRALLIWDLRVLFTSGGPGGPNIPFDLIVDVDIDDPSTWREPDQLLLDLGFSIWFRQKCTANHPEACGTSIYLGKVEGNAVLGLLKAMDLAPSDIPSLRQKLYLVEGDWDAIDLFIISYVRRRVSASEKVLVVSTGRRSGWETSGRGHYHSLEVRPASESAVQLFGSTAPRFVPDYLLKPYTP